jgi:hypothetical protein
MIRRAAFIRATAGVAVAAAGAAPVCAARPAGAALDGRTRVPVVRARIGSRDLVLAVDTGDAESSLSVQAADALGLARTPVPSSPFARATLRGVALAGATLRDHSVLVGDVSNWTPLVGFAVDGSLGYEAFRDRVVTIDYRNGRLFFPDALPDGESTPITWLKYHERSPQLVTFDGLMIDGFPATAQLDTAMRKNAIVFTTKLPELLIDNAPKDPLYTYEGATLVPGKVGSVRLGTTTLAAPSVVVYSADAKAHVPTTAISVVVGDELFKRRAVTLDFPNSTLIVS